jgi:hypothetical protein
MSVRNEPAGTTRSQPLPRGPIHLATPTAVAVVTVVAVAALVTTIMFGFLGQGSSPVPLSSTTPGPTATVAPTASLEPTLMPEPTSPPPTRATPVITPTPAPTPVASSSWVGIEWSDSFVPFPRRTASGHVIGDELVDTMIRDVVWWGGRYVAAGTIDRSIFGCGLIEGGCVDEPRAPAFFISEDARHWTVTQELPMTAEDPAHDPQALLAFDSRLFALSGDAVWSSSDGTAWTQIDSPTWQGLWQVTPQAFPRLIAAASGPSAIIAIGAEQVSGASVVARSTDGQAWTGVSLPNMPEVVVRDVVAHRDGFVIVGRAGQPDRMGSGGGDSEHPTMPGIAPGVGAPAAWVSLDGVTWTAASVEGTSVLGGGIEQVLAGTDGLFAVGISTPAPDSWESLALAHWWSSDGMTWHQGGAMELDLPADPALASDGTNMIVLGADPGRPDELAGWVSLNGRSWAPLAMTGSPDVRVHQWFPEPMNEPLHRVDAVWVVPDGVIVNGRNYYSGTDDDIFWFGTAIER